MTEIDPKDQLRISMLSSLETHTKVMYYQQYKRPFVVNAHHKRLFEALQRVVDGKCTRLIINMPPRYSKTEVCVKNFISWCFALNAKCKFLHLSYSDALVMDNSNTVKEAMCEPLYQELFPQSRLLNPRQGGTKWQTAAGGEMYAVPTKGQVTGFGAGAVDFTNEEDSSEADIDTDDTPTHTEEFDSLFEEYLAEMSGKDTGTIFYGAIVIDDPVKPEDALSDNVRESINQRFETTIRNRVNSRKTPIIIIMQRLHEHDLCGYLQELEPEEWEVLSLPAITTDPITHEEKPLWAQKHTLDELHKIRTADSIVFDTQYMQDPRPLEGMMYAGFKTYDVIPHSTRRETKNYTDTADTGKDFLCSINFVQTEVGCYVTDVLFTDKPMEYTETATTDLINKGNVITCKIESNNGGRGFARTVERMLRMMGNLRTKVVWFSQTLNKEARIFSKSAIAQNIIYFPTGWDTDPKWKKFHDSLTGYRKDGKNSHDDAPDALTGVVEMFESGMKKCGIKRKN